MPLPPPVTRTVRSRSLIRPPISARRAIWRARQAVARSARRATRTGEGNLSPSVSRQTHRQLGGLEPPTVPALRRCLRPGRSRCSSCGRSQFETCGDGTAIFWIRSPGLRAPAVVEGGGGDVARVGRGEEGDDAGDVLRGLQPP